MYIYKWEDPEHDLIDFLAFYTTEKERERNVCKWLQVRGDYERWPLKKVF